MPNSFLDSPGLRYLWSKIKNLLNEKVDKISGKGLSTNDFTTALKNRVDSSILTTDKGVVNGVASLDTNAKVPIAQFPIVPIANGGTGSSTSNAAIHSLINSATSMSSSGLASGDYIGIDDVSAGTGKKISISQLLSYISSNSGGVQIQLGSYTGTGTHGASNPNNITCSFAPKMVIFYGGQMAPGGIPGVTFMFPKAYYGFAIRDPGKVAVIGQLSGLVTSFNTKVSWYTSIDDARTQMNFNNTTYHWVAFG